MLVKKCDGCGKALKNRRDAVAVSGERIKNYHVDFCERCGKPFVALLKKIGLMAGEAE